MKFIQGKLGDILQESMQQQWKGVETDKTGESRTDLGYQDHLLPRRLVPSRILNECAQNLTSRL